MSFVAGELVQDKSGRFGIVMSSSCSDSTVGVCVGDGVSASVLYFSPKELKRVDLASASDASALASTAAPMTNPVPLTIKAGDYAKTPDGQIVVVDAVRIRFPTSGPSVLICATSCVQQCTLMTSEEVAAYKKQKYDDIEKRLKAKVQDAVAEFEKWKKSTTVENIE